MTRRIFKNIFLVLLFMTLVSLSSTKYIYAQEENVTSSYDTFNISQLLADDQLIITPADKVSTSAVKSTTGTLFSVSSKELSNTIFTFSNEFDFNENTVSKICFDALAQKDNKLSIEFFIDDSSDAFASAKIVNQKRKNLWTTAKTNTIDISSKKISGKHTISFKIVQSDSNSDVSFLFRTVTFMQSTIPTIYFNIDESEGSINAMNTDPEHDTECYGSMTLQIPDGYTSEYTSKILSTQTYNLEYIRGRGNSTWCAEKKPYKLKLDKKANLLGMGSNSHWVLLANYYDNSLLRNKITYNLGKKTNTAFTPECVYVDVVMNGEYYGNYLLCEQVRVGNSRVDIDNLEDDKDSTDPAIISGGYLLSMSPYGNEDETTFSTEHASFLIESPDFKDYTNETQINYIKNYLQKVEDAIYSDDFCIDGTHYSELLDLDSTIDYFWIQEFSCNGDAFLSNSTYMYKTREGKLYFGPLWDFDYVAWGNLDTDFYQTETWSQIDNFWFSRLFQDKTFAKKVVDRWPYIKEQLEKIYEDGGAIDQYAKEIIFSQKYNFSLCPYAINEYFLYNADIINNDKLYKEDNIENLIENPDELKNSFNYKNNVLQLKEWIKKRIDWIDKNVNSLNPKECTITYVDGDTILKTQSATTGTYENLSYVPSKDDYYFSYWTITSGLDELDVCNPFYITGNITLNAHWISKKDAIIADSIVINTNKITLPTWYYEYDLKTTILPLNAIALPLQWSSSNEDVAEVNQTGIFIIISEGTTVITATEPISKKSVSCTVTIDDSIGTLYPDSVSLDKNELSLLVGGYDVIRLISDPIDSFPTNARWVSTNSDIAEVTSSGIVTAKKAGTATIIAINTFTDDICTCNVTVKEKVLSYPSVGKKVTMGTNVYTILTSNATSKTVEYTKSTNKNAVTIDIPKTITIENFTYEVTSVSKTAFDNCKKLEKVTKDNKVIFSSNKKISFSSLIKKIISNIFSLFH